MKILKLSKKLVSSWLPKRKQDSHKGDYGHVLIVAGSKGMSGASILSAQGALRGGAGLVTLAVPESRESIVAKKVRPEVMTLAMPESKAGTFSQKAVAPLLEFVRKRKITSLAIGPGLSRNLETVRFVKKFFLLLKKNWFNLQGIVLDADGFLALKPKNSKYFFLKNLGLPVIVTPHPGELANFLEIKSEEIQKARIQFAKEFAKLYSVVCVLKGHQTTITDGREVYLNTTGNPGMATGGSGDVLTGLIAALIAQIQDSTPHQVGGKIQSDLLTSSFQPPASTLLLAACAGVYIHGLAGDLAKKEKTEMGMIAGDIAEKIPAAFNAVLQ